jgi:hemoglobin/transferrin/lactoferrin receptor protein
MDELDFNLNLNETDQRDEFLQNHDTPPPLGPGGSRDKVNSNLYDQETVGLSLSASKIFGTERPHQLSYGFDWDTTQTIRSIRETRTQSDGTVIKDDLTAPFPKNTTERLGVYLQDTVDLTDKWSLIPGVRYDYYKMTPKADEGYDSVNPGEDNAAEEISDSNVSWRLGTIYEFTDNFSAWFQYSQGFKVPPYDLAYFYYEHFIVFPCCTIIETIPNADLVPEESDSFEAGIRGTAGNLSYSFSAYRSDYDNFIQIFFFEPGFNWDFGFPIPEYSSQYQNIENAEISGFEFHFDYYLGSNVSMFLNGEWMDSEDKSTGDQLRTIQPFKGTLGLNYFRGNFSMDAMMKYAAEMDNNPEGTYTSDSYATVDLFARYDFNGKAFLSVGVFNLLDEKYVEYTSIAGLPNDLDDIDRFTEPGRTFSARVKFEF